MVKRFIELTILFLFWFLFTTPIHEYAHYQVGKWIGLKVWVEYQDLFSGMCHFQGSSDLLWLAYLAGGLVTGTLMLLLAFRAIHSPTLADEADAFVLTVLGLGQIGYGIGELSYLYLPDYSMLCVTVGTITGVLVAVRLRFISLIEWLERGDEERPKT